MSLSNVSASVRDRLLNRARETGESHQALLTRYALERLLYRIGSSEVEEQFVLKGAYAFLVWQQDLHRPTKDLDLLGYGDPDKLEALLRRVCEVEVQEDGVSFDPDSVSAGPIRDQEEYDGMRVTIEASIGSAELQLQVDVGFGDAVVPDPQVTEIPTLLDLPAAKLRTYPRETVVAEKLHGMVMFGIANSRMKDFYDIWYLSTQFPFEGADLSEAIEATFSRRETEIPTDLPLALADEFADDDRKQTQWESFEDRTQLEEFDADFVSVIAQLRSFLWPPLRRAGQSTPFEKHWSPEGPWAVTE
ncbi:nucleotidyl transferase AbiEii/AbiGii toxin family protein [Salinibacter ruber]|jgi:predicted nucleotidyltransferase component of viral defense system|uniref:nucleotidyl transferase AbiEii/AbiGii toxin family protein n=1 Tax=Salinibacter ruber TaxID=146919 RepID=UPI002168ECDD|nr:nucleotidyl transferase AbiEii/AbiGii toxin family protein [Salinibacter ruber]MCS4038726.1 putative nucleotidyltransferase component of viral defense system [Salinibacter ruber]